MTRFSAASVEREDHHQRIRWSAPGAATVAVFAGPRAAADRQVGAGGGEGDILVADAADGGRRYFTLVADGGPPLLLAERSLHLAGAPNCRDVGGYRTRDGRWVRMGLAYRSDGLETLTDADVAALRRIDVGTVCDLRTDVERQREPSRLPEGAAGLVANVVAEETAATGMMAAMLGDSAGQEEGLTPAEQVARYIAFIDESYRRLVASATARSAYRLLQESLAAGDRALVFHCTGGRDRTGWAQAVLLTALGVSRDTVTADYLLSNVYLVERARRQLARLAGRFAPALIEAMIEVRGEYLAAGFDEVERRHGSFDAYLRDGIGLDDATLHRLRDRFLA